MPKEDVDAFHASSREKQTQVVNNAISKSGDSFVIDLKHPSFEERRKFIKTNSRGGPSWARSMRSP